MEIKEWLVSCDIPSDKVSKDGISVDVGGMKWSSALGGQDPPTSLWEEEQG